MLKFDMSGFDRETILNWYRLTHLGRKLDDKAASYLKMAKGWSYHAPCAGHDGIQIAIGQVFRAGKDFLFPYYRDLMTCLSAGITPLEIILNGLSKDGDVAGGGRHMSNHFAKPSIRIQNGSSCTGNHCQHAAGTARGIKKYNGDEVAIYSGGDSACAEGYFYEAVNGANTEKLPVIFVIQNNKFGISVPLREAFASERVSDVFTGMKNLKIINCDGRDVFDSYRAMKEAVEYCLSGAGPAMVHADCDRIGSHSNSDNHELYRTKEEIDEMKKRDPLPRFRAAIIENGIATDDELKALEKANTEEMYVAADIAEASPDPSPESYSEFLLPPSVVEYSDNSESRFVNDPNAQQYTFREAINIAMKEEFQRNPNTFLWGQDVASVNKQGIFNVPKGMLDEFGNDRVFNAPIAEDYIVGTANGMSRYREDIRIVVEGAEFADYFHPAMEQLIECSHDYWRTRGQFSPNIVIRLASGGYIQGGLYHSQNLDAIFAHLPGIRVVCPAFADDAIGLMRNAIRSQGTTMYLEPKFLYNYRPTSTSKPADDFIIPFGKAKVRRPGTDVTVVSYGNAIHIALRAAEKVAEEGINAEVIDLRSLRPWDKERVLESVKRTSRAVVAHEHYRTGGFGGEVASTITEECFRYLDAPVARVASKDVPVGFSKVLESAILLNEEQIADAIRSTIKW
ncbi:MAG: 2-oxoisovalerate dehydrogenase [Candidatus Kapabacteria bacterium]|nr:2-oxoisovalerate dehydrogenase [Candidatus Kapabacteria bacterium]